MKDLLGEDYIELRYTSKFKKVNPMVIKYGQLDGETCKTCNYLTYRGTTDKVFPKCKLRGITSGAGTDHLVNWEACNKFNP